MTIYFPNENKYKYIWKKKKRSIARGNGDKLSEKM